MQYRIVCALYFGLMLIASGAAMGANSNNASGQAQLAQAAAQVLHAEMQQEPKNQIPKNLLSAAQCIAVVPSKLKVAVIGGGSHGNGLMSCRTQNDGWSAPVFFEISSGSVGAQIGGKTTQLIFLVMNKNIADNMIKGNFKFSANATGTGGTLGAHADVNTHAAPVFIYRVGSQGLFAGAHVKGSRFDLNQDANKQIYGNDFNARNVLQGKATKNNQVKPYIQALNDLAPQEQHKQG